MSYNCNLESIYAFWKKTEHFRSDHKFQGFVIFQGQLSGLEIFGNFLESVWKKQKKTARSAKSQFLKTWKFDLGKLIHIINGHLKMCELILRNALNNFNGIGTTPLLIAV